MKTELFKRMFFKGISKLLEETEEIKLIRDRINKLHELLGAGEVDTIEKTASEYIYLVTIKNSVQIIYATKDSFLFLGNMYSIDDGSMVNLNEVAEKEKMKKIIDNLNIEDMIVYKTKLPLPNPHVIHVFTDVDCGYCRKLHKEINELKKLNIEVRYLAFPRAGIDSNTYKKMVSAWCSENKTESMDKLMKKKKIKEKECVENPVKKQYNLGYKLGIRGTPTIILPDGGLVSGYLPAKQLAGRLGITPN